MIFEKEIHDLKVKGLYKELPLVQSDNSHLTKVNDRTMINLSSNNYLGLANNERVNSAAVAAIKKYGVGCASARNIIGNNELYNELEQDIASFKREEAALIFQSGYTVNLGLIPLIARENDLIISDELNHASIIDGIRMSKAKKIVYKHMDMEALRDILRDYRLKYNRVLIITDTVFSMDGDIAPLDKIVHIAQEYDAMTYFDDAHGSGVLGKNGRGAIDHYGLTGKVDFTVATISKAISSVGGYVVGSKYMRDWVMRNSRPILFSTSLPPSSLAAAKEMFAILSESDELTKKLWENTRYFSGKLKTLGINIGKTKTPIIPVIIGDELKTKQFGDELITEGILASPILYPVVPKSEGRVRCIVTAEHTKEELDKCIDIIKQLFKSYCK